MIPPKFPNGPHSSIVVMEYENIDDALVDIIIRCR